MSMRIMRKIWATEAAGRPVELECSSTLLLRTRAELRVDGRVVASTPPRFRLAPIRLEGVIDGPHRLVARIGHRRYSFKTLHQIMLDGAVISGEREFHDDTDERYPDRSWWHYLATRGVMAGLAYCVVMLAIGQFSFARPWALLGSFAFFSLFMATCTYATGRVARRQR